MKINTFLIIILVMLSNISSSLGCEKYQKLKNKCKYTIKMSDLPKEFSRDALRTVNDFIQKTGNLYYEVLLFFDYYTGEILDCAFGESENVTIHLDKSKFDGKHVASIHNHPSDVFSPPSEKNFGILLRDFEDYEIIIGKNIIWILKAKCVNDKLAFDLKLASSLLFYNSIHYCQKNYSNLKEINNNVDELYGELLLKYINDKNINGIQLTKVRINHD